MRALSAVTLMGLSCGCTSLPDIDAGICGNGIEESGEDCDSSQASCRPPGSEDECRFDCSIQADGTRRACPTGYGCGLAGNVCRRASGGFQLAAGPESGDTLYVAAADFNADGRDDVLTVALNSIAVHFSGPDGDSSDSVKIASPPLPPAVGRLSDQEGMSFALAAGGVSVERGRDDNTISAGAYAPFPLSPDTIAVGLVDAIPWTGSDFANIGDEVVGFAPLGNDVQVREVISAKDLFTLPVSEKQFCPEVLHADLDPETASGEELIVPIPGGNKILIFALSHPTATGYAWSTTAQTVVLTLPSVGGVTLNLPEGPKVSGRPPPPTIVLADVNGDGYQDIVAEGKLAGASKMLFVLGDGQGGFYSPASWQTNPADNQLGLYVEYNQAAADQSVGLANGQPLAVGDLNLDGTPDFVVENGINLSQPRSPGWVRATATDFPWHAAAIGNFNGDAYPDVVAAAYDGQRVDLLVGNGFGFNVTHISTSSKVRGFAVGDFDGNLIGDVAVTETVTLPDNSTEDVLSMLFGRAGAPLESPVELGRFQQIRAISGGDVFSFNGALDGVTDLGVFAISDDAPKAALFVGNTQRRIESAFSLTLAPNTPDEAIAYATRAVAGNFDGVGPNDDLALLTIPPSAQLGVDTAVRLWLAPATGDAELDLAVTTASDPVDFPNFVPCGMLFAPVDLGGNDLDELVSFGFSGADANAKGEIVVADVEQQADGLHRFHVSAPVEVPEIYLGKLELSACAGAAATLSDQTSVDGRAQVVDVNGDGWKDILVSGLFVSLADKPPIRPKIIVFENHGDGGLDVTGRRDPQRRCPTQRSTHRFHRDRARW